MITVHHLNHSRSMRVIWLLEELSIPYEVKYYQRNPATLRAPKALKKIHPLGKAPVISDGDLVLAESGAILNYLAQAYGKDWLPPAKTQEAFRCDYWLHYAEGSLMPLLFLRLVFERTVLGSPFFIKPITKMISNKVNKTFISPQLKNHLHFIESHLAQSAWFAGEAISIADIQMSYPLAILQERKALEVEYPHCLAWLDKIHSRPAYQAAKNAAKC